MKNESQSRKREREREREIAMVWNRDEERITE